MNARRLSTHFSVQINWTNYQRRTIICWRPIRSAGFVDDVLPRQGIIGAYALPKKKRGSGKRHDIQIDNRFNRNLRWRSQRRFVSISKRMPRTIRRDISAMAELRKSFSGTALTIIPILKFPGTQISKSLKLSKTNRDRSRRA